MQAPSAHSHKPFTCSTFCADNKMIAALTDAQVESISPSSLDTDECNVNPLSLIYMFVCKVVVWQWEREKLYKSASISAHVTILRGAPCASLLLTGSG